MDVIGAGGGPRIRFGIVSSAGVRYAVVVLSTPYYHFTASPDCCVKAPGSWRIHSAGSCPTVHFRIVSPAGVHIVRDIIGKITSPDNHFAAGPDCRVVLSAKRRVGSTGDCPTIHARIVSPTRCRSAAVIRSTPDDHFATGPNSRVIGSTRWRARDSCPSVRRRIVSPAAQKADAGSRSTPYNHFAASPDHGEIRLIPHTGDGRVGDTGSCPSIIGAARRLCRGWCLRPTSRETAHHRQKCDYSLLKRRSHICLAIK